MVQSAEIFGKRVCGRVLGVGWVGTSRSGIQSSYTSLMD